MTTATAWTLKRRERAYAPGDGPGLHARAAEPWLRAVRGAFPAGGGHLDVGCGAGRMTFALADRWSSGGWSLGLDRDEEALARARERARAEGLAGADFLSLDVEAAFYESALADRVPDLVTAHLCMSPEIAERAARVLAPGGVFAFVALHPDLWRETGQTSRFALGETDAEAILARHGFAPSFLRVEKERIRFDDPSSAMEGFFDGERAASHWKANGRWEGLLRHFENGGRTLTLLAQTQCIARKTP